jgi:hypothetical protein
MLILDFDLDFIVRPIRRGASDLKSRYEDSKITIWNAEMFRSFFENKMHLSTKKPISGRACEHHKEVYTHMADLIGHGTLIPPLHWVHIDAHDDIMGCSDSQKINSANFILHLIGQDWIKHLDLVLPANEDRPPDCLIKWNPLRIEFSGHSCTINYPNADTYQLPEEPDFVFLTHSPDFTPKVADKLFELAQNYIRE